MTDVHTLAGAYALDAVTDIERAAFARHIAECEACAQEVAELRETVARLGGTNSESPPERLRGQVLARVAETRQAGPVAPVRRRYAGAPKWRRSTAIGVAAAALVAGAGAVGYEIQEQRLRDADARAEHSGAIAAVFGAADARLRTASVGGGQVTVVVSDSRNQAVAVLSDLAAPGAGHAYQLWLITGNTATSAGVLAAGSSGGARLVDGVRGAQLFGVTLEPAGGSKVPTQPLVTSIPLT